MTLYEKLTAEADAKGFIVAEVPLEHSGGIIYKNRIGIRAGQTSAEKACVLAEEMAHAQYTVGNILDQTDAGNRKQEYLARLKAYDKLIGLPGIVRAFSHGCRNRLEMADFLDVTEEFLQEALECYRGKYGISTTYDGFTIQFEPCLSVFMRI